MKRAKCIVVAAVLLLSQVIIEIHDDSVSVTAAQDVEVNVPPVVEILPDVSRGMAPLIVHFDGDLYDEDGEILSLEWDFEGDGVFEFSKSVKDIERSQRLQALKLGLQREHIYSNPGIYHAVARVTDDKGESSISSVTIQVHSDRPYLDITPCDTEFDYMAQAGYEAFFKSGITDSESIRFQMGNYWISYQWENQLFGEIGRVKGVPEGNKIWYKNVFSNCDIRYTVHNDLLLEELIVHQFIPVTVIEQSFTIHGVKYKMEEDGSIGFYNGEDLVFSIPRPVMYEFDNPENKSYGLHYEIVERGNDYLLRKIIDDLQWLQKAQYPVVIDSSTQGEIADPWEQQGLTPYGQYFKNLNEYVDPLTGHLTIRHTDYSLSGRGLDLSVTRVYSTVVAYKEEEDGSGEFVPVSTYIEAPTDLGYGWSLDFPWMEVENNNPGEYMHLPNGGQVQINFQNGVWNCPSHEFIVYDNPDNTYTKYRRNGIKEEYDSMGRLTSITDLDGNAIVFTYGQYGILTITDTVGRVLTFSYSGGKLMSILDGVRTVSYGYSGDKLVSVTDPIGRVTLYEYLSGGSFIITGVTYPTGGFSSYEYATVVPEFAKIAPYKSSESEDGETKYYIYKVDSADTIEWTSAQDIASVLGGGRPCVFQRDDGSLVMYYRDTYIWTEEICHWVGCPYDCQWVCETITHTEYWIKRSVSFDQHHWSTPENVVQVKSTTGNPVVIEKQNGTFIMYYKDRYVWTEQNCYWEGCPRDCQYICETITHTEHWIYRRASTDGLVWGSPVKIQQTATGIRNIAVIQKHDSSFLMCYTDKVGSSYYIRQKTSSDGITWSSPSNVVQVNSGTGNPALLQTGNGTIYLAYRKGNNYIYVLSNSGSGWSSPVQTTGIADGDPALLESDSQIVIIYKGTDEYCYRISSSDGIAWSAPSQIAPNKALTDPATVDRKDVFYRVTSQQISASAFDPVKMTEFSYGGDDYLARSTDVLISEDQTLKSSMHFGYDSKGRVVERIARDENGTQKEKIIYTYNSKNKVIRQDVYAGISTDISYSVITAYDGNGNVIYTKGPEGAEHYYSYANTDYENQFTDSKGLQVNLFSDSFCTNSVPSQCHNLIVGEAYINNGKAQETYYQYDTNGNLTETKTLFPTRDYVVFSGTFDENGQTTFEFDLTGLTVTNGILVISSIAVPTQETLHETHSEIGNGWLNSGTWDEENFMADYLRCIQDPLDCWDGQTEIGPFKHYPGTPHYTGYTTWIDGNTQYVQTDYLAVVNEYPEEVQYKSNSGSWAVITDNLGSGTTSITISSSEFVQGVNTLYFQESNTYSTKFEWTLYIDQGSTPEEYTTNLTYDTYGNISSITDALGNTTSFGYDANTVYLTSITNALNHTMSAGHDFGTGRITSITDAKGNTTSFEYDILGRVTKKINPDLTEKEAVYDDLNNAVTIYDELDHYIMKYYDGLGRLTKTEWYLSPTEKLTELYTYNYQNRLVTRTDQSGHVYSYEYDSGGRETKMINPDSTFKKIQYDDIANIMTFFDENNHKKQYHYDWRGNLLWVKEYTDSANYYLTQYVYDSVGNLTSMTDANGNTTFYDHDSLFGVTQVTYPDSTIETFSFDSVGNLSEKTDANGTTTFMYNTTYQLTGIQYPDQSISFEYDANGNHTLVTDSAGSTNYTYDNRNRLTSETRTFGGQQYSMNYGYDAASRITSIIYPDQSVITYQYDALSRLTSIPGYADFTYTADSLLDSMTFGNGIETSYQYDNRNRPAVIHAQKDGTDLLIMNYQYDPVDNITQLDYHRRLPDQQWAESTETFSYDWLDRLVAAQGDYGLLSYSYDSVGNRLSSNNTTYIYNSMNELLSISDDIVYTYDEVGNTLTKTSGANSWYYTYDYNNHLVQVEKNQQILAQYSYDGDGRRIKKTEWIESLQDYQTTIYVYSGLDIFYEKNPDTAQEAIYVYGPSGRIAKKVGELIDFYHTDHLSSTKLITNESGNVVTDLTYSPFGEDSLNGQGESYLFTGKEKDSTGLYYYGARYYDPEIGRFTTRDAVKGHIKNPQSLNLYSYCLNNPLKYIDPSGHDPEDIVDEIFQNLLNLTPEQLAESLDEYIQEEGEGDLLKALEQLLNSLGLEATITEFLNVDGEKVMGLEISIEVNGETYGGIQLYVDEKKCEEEDAFGIAYMYQSGQGKIAISKEKHDTVAELATTILHEICHQVLWKEYPWMNTDYGHHHYIYRAQEKYMGKVAALTKEAGLSNPYGLGYRRAIRLNWLKYLCWRKDIPIYVLKGNSTPDGA